MEIQRRIRFNFKFGSDLFLTRSAGPQPYENWSEPRPKEFKPEVFDVIAESGIHVSAAAVVVAEYEDVASQIETVIGGADTAVNPSQAREQKRAFDWLEVPSELLIFPGEEHEIPKPSSTRTRLEAEVAWFDHYLLGKPLPKPK